MEEHVARIDAVARDFLRAVLNRPSGMQTLEFLENNILGMLQGRTFNRIHQEFNALYDGHITIDDAIKDIYWINYQSYYNSLDGFNFLRKHLLEFKVGTIGHFYSKNLFSEYNQCFKTPEERNAFLNKLVASWKKKIFVRQLDGTTEIKDRTVPIYKAKPFYRRKFLSSKVTHHVEVEERAKIGGYPYVIEMIQSLRKVEKSTPVNEIRLDDELQRLYGSMSRLIRNICETKMKFAGKEKWNSKILEGLDREVHRCWEFLKRSGNSVALASGTQLEASVALTDYQLKEIGRKVNNLEELDDLPGIFQDIFVLDFRYFLLLKHRDEAADRRHTSRINKYSLNNKAILDRLVDRLEAKLGSVLGDNNRVLNDYYIKNTREFIRVSINRIQYSSVDSKFSDVLGKLTGDLSLKRGSKQADRAFEEDEDVKNILELGKNLRKILAQKGFLKLANYIYEWHDDELARGGQGAVTFGFNPKSQSLVVLKRPLLTTKSNDQIAEIVDRMKNEADINKELKHQNIIFCGGIYEDRNKNERQGRHAIIQEFFPGEDLLEILKKNYKAHLVVREMQRRGAQAPHQEKSLIRWLHAKEFWLQALAAIAAMTSKDITHRDLKPDNFMVLFNSDPDDDENYLISKLTDFGSAVKGYEVQGISLSYPYHSPEHLKGLGLKDLDRDQKSRIIPGKTDIFSLGEIMFEVFCGFHPLKAVFKKTMDDLRTRRTPGQTEITVYLGAHSHFYNNVLVKKKDGKHPELKAFNQNLVHQIGPDAYEDLSRLLKAMRAFYPDNRPDPMKLAEQVDKFFDKYFTAKKLKEPVTYEIDEDVELVEDSGATVTIAVDEATKTVTGSILDIW